MKEQARSFRKSMTPAETLLWNQIRNRQLNGHKFVRELVIGYYIVDFACRKKKIIIEVDGSEHEQTVEYDEQRTKLLESLGYKVLRFWNDEVFDDIHGVLDVILDFIESVQ